MYSKIEKKEGIKKKKKKAHSTIIHNSQKVELAQMSIGRWMDKSNEAHSYRGVLFSYKKD